MTMRKRTFFLALALLKLLGLAAENQCGSMVMPYSNAQKEILVWRHHSNFQLLLLATAHTHMQSQHLRMYLHTHARTHARMLTCTHTRRLDLQSDVPLLTRRNPAGADATSSPEPADDRERQILDRL